MQEIHEECGVFGAWSPKPQNLADLAYYGLYALQHRGQESCGIVVNEDGVFTTHRDLGQVGDAFTRDVMSSSHAGPWPWAMCVTEPPVPPTRQTASPLW